LILCECDENLIKIDLKNMEKLFDSVQDQIKKSYMFIEENFEKKYLERFLYPDQIIEFPVSIKMDNGEIKTFLWRRSQHSNVRGPYKGGIRFHPKVSKDEVMSLSAWMSLKTAVVGIPLGGGKWWISVDPKELSQPELERLSRVFMQKLAPHIWPNTDIPAPDINTTPQIMAWMADEYSKIAWWWTPWVITGKPLEIWWSKGRTNATAFGWFLVLETFLRSYSDNIKNKSIAIQWAGNVGLIFAEIAQKAWAKIIAISDSKWWVYASHWLDIEKIIELKKAKKSVIELNEWKIITNEKLLELNVDVLAPAALENVIHNKNVDNIKAKLIIELANWPIDCSADEILKNKWIKVLPDILANAGGVTVSYFEQVQNNTNYYRQEKEVNEKLSDIMVAATYDVIRTADKYNTTLRNWAYILALWRLLEVATTRRL